jgi:putative FmdB family regulatory protein
MPTYEYRCAAGHEFELVQRMSEAPVKECPECGAAAERLLSKGGGLLFKGSGFYITDYRSDSYKKAAAADGGATPASSETAPKKEAPAAKEPASGKESGGSSAGTN